MTPVLCLASASPRRRELLSQIGVSHIVAGAEIDESVLPGETPRAYVIRLARAKALAIQRAGQQLPVLAADTTVVVDGKIFGKPRDRAQGVYMLGELAGRAHEVLTAVALANSHGVSERLSSSTVRFRQISPEECVAYWETGEPRDKAGGYAIQGLGAVFVESLSGSYSGVMGLPLFETGELLQAAGIEYWNGSGPSGDRA
ncbi:MAG: nucleoside triphosphate pyrophosphatase [Gammaproteobacteria bacterium]|jgi:septum formation protein|nr:nucleoside triphosphate pyrophosphatase [Gammaproteobacteria bacterium]